AAGGAAAPRAPPPGRPAAGVPAWPSGRAPAPPSGPGPARRATRCAAPGPPQRLPSPRAGNQLRGSPCTAGRLPRRSVRAVPGDHREPTAREDGASAEASNRSRADRARAPRAHPATQATPWSDGRPRRRRPGPEPPAPGGRFDATGATPPGEDNAVNASDPEPAPSPPTSLLGSARPAAAPEQGAGVDGALPPHCL